MKKAILATKVGMTQIFNEDGVLTPVTVLQAGPCVVTQVKTEENDGYKAVQVGFVDKREKLVTKPVKGHFDTASTEDRWLTVPSSIVIRVPTVLQPHRDAYLRAKECRVTWAA